MHVSEHSKGSAPGLALLVAVAALSLPGSAQAEGLHYSIGILAGAGQSPFETVNPDTGLIPDILIEGDRFSFGTSGLTFDLLEGAGLTVSARLAPRWFAADPSDVSVLEHLKRDIAVETGLSARLDMGNFAAEVEALTDVSDTHGGAAVNAALSTGISVTDRFTVGAKAGATWMDADLATYTYGVLPDEATGSLSAYRVKASVIPSISLNASYALSDTVSLTGSLETSFLPDSVTNSPIVKRDSVTSVMVGMRYGF